MASSKISTTESKVCQAPGCDVVIFRSLGLSRARWEEKKYCCNGCVGRAKRSAIYGATKGCDRAGCRAVVTRDRNDTPKMWEAKRYCSRACQAIGVAARRRAEAAYTRTPPKTCANPACGALFHRGPGRSQVAWEARVYCGPECSAACAGQLRWNDAARAAAKAPRGPRVKPADPPELVLKPTRPVEVAPAWSPVRVSAERFRTVSR